MSSRSKNKLFLLLYFSISLASYGQITLPSASFQLSTNAGCVPLTINVTNTSANASQFEWDFGNGMSSTVAQPTIMYASKGVFDITLIAKDAIGNSDTLTFKNAVTVNDKPLADFTFFSTSVCLNQNQTHFTNLSTPGLNYMWDFGDGNSSTLVNPIHSYADSGSYAVNLMVADNLGCIGYKQTNQAIKIIEPDTLSFSVNDTVSCDTSTIFSFHCTTDSITNWLWDFGDGNSSTLQQPKHKYANAGSYDVSLITLNHWGCSDTLEKKNHITVRQSIESDFSASITSGCAPLDVDFTVDSIYQHSTYEWIISNGSRQNGDSATFTFDTAGNYSVSLISTHLNGCVDTTTKASLISVMGAAPPSFSVDTTLLCANGLIQFLNTSQFKNSLTFSWDFGDGVTSTVADPFHSYTLPGSYVVKLTATDSNTCSNTFSKTVNIRKINAAFTALQTKGCAPFTADFQNLGLVGDSWFWDFGDGDTSHQQHPTHNYQTSGKFDVKLVTETNSGCIDSVLYHDYIEVFDDTLTESLTDTIEGCLPMPVDFSDNQFGSTSWIWDFGNGDTSMIKNPTYTYYSPGTYTVSLKTFNSNGCPIYVKNYATFVIDSIIPEVSAITFDCSSRTIQLTDSTKNISSWFWSFSDGTYSTLQSPIHQFSDTLIYGFSLTLISKNGCIQSVTFPGFIDFRNCLVGGEPANSSGGGSSPNSSDTLNSANALAQRCSPQIVQLSNPDTNAFAWNWDFGDGNSSTLEHPIHVYRTPGVYDVQLITTNPRGKDTIFWNDYIAVHGPVANFNFTKSFACDSATVIFNNTSQKSHSWAWKFHNFVDSINFSPQRKFAYSNRNHAVQLLVKDSAGCQASKISVLNLPLNETNFFYLDSACVGDTVTFSAADSSSSYVWNFGNGHTDSSFTSYQVYAQAGTYPITVSRKDTIGCETTHFLDSITIKGSTAEFQILDTSNCVNQYFSFSPNSLNSDSYLWNFGSNLTSNLKSPSIKLTQSGIFNVTLSTEKDGCRNSYTHPTAITVKEVKADFEVSQLNHCYPIQLVLTDTNSNSAQWDWKINGVSVSNTNQHYFTTHDSSIHISLKVTAANGCTDSISQLYIPSTLNSNFEISDTLGCAPFNVSFNNNAKHAASSFWSFGDGDTSHASNPVHLYKNEGIYSVRLITSSLNGCLDTTIVQNAIRVSSVKANYGASFNSSCAPMLVNFADSSSNATSWKWNFGDKTSSTVANPLKIFNKPGEFDVTLVASNNDGCKDTLSIQNRILVPGPITKFSASDTMICGVSPVQFVDSSDTAIQWNWIFGDGATSTQQHPQHTYTATGEYSVTLSTVDSSGCTGFYTLPKKLKVGRQPNAGFQLLDSLACSPFELNLSANDSSIRQWKWSLGNDTIILDSAVNYTFEKAGSYSISLVVRNEAGCSDSSRFDSLRVLHTPDSRIDSASAMCSNEKPIKLHAHEDGGRWSGIGISDSQIGIFNPFKANNGKNTIKYSFQGACPSSDSIQIEVKEAPHVDFTVDKEEACFNLEASFETVYFKSISSNLQPSYSWKQNGIPFGNTSAVKKSFNQGVFDISLEVKTSNGCNSVVTKPQLIKVHDSLPSQSVIKQVSVLSDYEVSIEWHKNPDLALSHHILYRKSSTDSRYSAIATISDANQTTYIDKALNTLDLVYCYKIVAIDKCDQELELKDLPAHCTINVSTYKANEHGVKVSWNKYVGCSVNYYEVVRSDKTSNHVSVIARLDSSHVDFLDSSAICSYRYNYKIKAIGYLGFESLSDTSEIKMNGIAKLQKSEIIRATVTDENAVLVEWTLPEVAPKFANGYVIHRSLDNKSFSPLTFLPVHKTDYTDQETAVKNKQYFYKVEVLNGCLNNNDLTNTGSSILLKSKQIDDRSGELNWTEYEKWDTGVKRYEVQRLNEFNQWETIEILPSHDRQLIINF